MAKFIRRITAIEATEEGTRAAKIYSASKKRRKVSRWLQPLERRQRRVLEASAEFASDLLDRHNRSNRKRRDGAYRDATVNVMRAQRKALKRLSKMW